MDSMIEETQLNHVQLDNKVDTDAVSVSEVGTTEGSVDPNFVFEDCEEKWPTTFKESEHNMVGFNLLEAKEFFTMGTEKDVIEGITTEWNISKPYPKSTTSYPIYIRSGWVNDVGKVKVKPQIPYGNPETFEKQNRIYQKIGEDWFSDPVLLRALVAYTHLKMPDKPIYMAKTEILMNLNFLDRLFGALENAKHKQISPKFWNNVYAFPRVAKKINDSKAVPADKDVGSDVVLSSENRQWFREEFKKWRKLNPKVNKDKQAKKRIELIRQAVARQLLESEGGGQTEAKKKFELLYSTIALTPFELSILTSPGHTPVEKLQTLLTAFGRIPIQDPAVFDPELFSKNYVFNDPIMNVLLPDFQDINEESIKKLVMVLESLKNFIGDIYNSDNVKAKLVEYDPRLAEVLEYKVKEVNQRPLIRKKNKSQRVSSKPVGVAPKPISIVSELEPQVTTHQSGVPETNTPKSRSENKRCKSKKTKKSKNKSRNIKNENKPKELEPNKQEAIGKEVKGEADSAVSSNKYNDLDGTTETFTEVFLPNGAEDELQVTFQLEEELIYPCDSASQNHPNLVGEASSLNGSSGVISDYGPQWTILLPAETPGRTRSPKSIDVPYDITECFKDFYVLKNKVLNVTDIVEKEPEIMKLSYIPISSFRSAIDYYNKKANEEGKEPIYVAGNAGPQYLVSDHPTKYLNEINLQLLVEDRTYNDKLTHSIPPGQLKSPYIKTVEPPTQEHAHTELTTIYIIKNKVVFNVNPDLLKKSNGGFKGKVVYVPNKVGVFETYKGGKRGAIRAYLNKFHILNIIKTNKQFNMLKEASEFVKNNWCSRALQLAEEYTKFKGLPIGQIRRYADCCNISMQVEAPKEFEVTLKWKPLVIPLAFHPLITKLLVLTNQFKMPAGSTIGPFLGNLHRGFNTIGLETDSYTKFIHEMEKWNGDFEKLLAMRDDPNEQVQYPYLVSGLFCSGKPKMELYERSKVTKKSRTIFALNSYTQFPLQLMLTGYDEVYGTGDKVNIKPGLNVLYAVDAVGWTKNFVNKYLKGEFDENQVYWLAYSDNFYALYRNNFYSFDGSKMEASCGKPIYMTKLLNMLKDQMNQPHVVQLNIPCDMNTELINGVENLCKSINDNYMEYQTTNKFSKLFVNVDLTSPHVTYFVPPTGDVYIDEVQELLTLVSGYAFTHAKMELNEDDSMITLTLEQSFKVPRWFNNYVTYVSRQMNSVVAVNGNSSVELDFMPSGNTFTTVLNTLVSTLTVQSMIDSGKTPDTLAQEVEQAKDGKLNLGTCVVTCENTLDMSILFNLEGREEGFIRFDMLGYDLFYKPKVGLSVILREPSLLAGSLYFNNDPVDKGDRTGKPSMQETTLAISMSYMVNGGTYLTDLMEATILTIARYPVVTRSILEQVLQLQQFNGIDMALPEDLLKRKPKRSVDFKWWKDFFKDCLKKSTIQSYDKFDVYMNEMSEALDTKLRTFVPDYPTEVSDISGWVHNWLTHVWESASDKSSAVSNTVLEAIDRKAESLGVNPDTMSNLNQEVASVMKLFVYNMLNLVTSVFPGMVLSAALINYLYTLKFMPRTMLTQFLSGNTSVEA